MAPSARSRSFGPATGPILVWLIACTVMVTAMMLIGAVTRLTESGLSMVEWRPLFGFLPPLSDSEWERVFGLYRQTSEYRLENPDMTLEEFQTIFWWEYVHRLWGRLIGVAFGLPLLWFALRRRIPSGMTPHLVTLFLLGGLQGVIGWWMVKSGFVDRDDVSQYRLAVHLGMALLIFGYMLWLILDLTAAPSRAAPPLARGLAGLVLVTVFLTALSGGFVAGLSAGFDYNTWPLIDGALVPDGLFDDSPWWMSAFESILTAQFDHRMLAYATLALALAQWLWLRRAAPSQSQRRAVAAVAGLAVLQAVLGISTLLSVVALPLAVAHQAGAVALFAAAVWTRHAMRG